MKRLRLRTLLVACGVAAAGLALIAFDVWRSYRSDIADAERESRNLAIALEGHTSRTIEAVDQALLALAARPELLAQIGRHRPDPASLAALEELMRLRTAGLPQLMWITAFDPSGRPVASTDRATAGLLRSVADRDYFKAAKSSDPADGSFVSAPFRGRASDRWTFVMSRRLTGPDGRFAGVLVAAVDPRFFADLYRHIDTGATGDVILLHAGGTVVARWPAHDEWVGRSGTASEFFRALTAKAEAGTFHVTTDVTRRDVLGSYRMTGDRRFIISVDLDKRDVLAPWRNSLVVYALAAIGIVLLTILAVVAGLRNLRRIETEREQSEAMLRALFDNASEGMLLADADSGLFHASNPAIRRMLGYSEGELARLRPPDLHPPENRAAVETQFAAMRRGEFDTLPALPVRRKDGQVFYADLSTLRLRLGGRDYLAGLFRDVTAARATQDALKRERDFATSLLDTAPVIVLLLDLQGRIEHVNRYFEGLTGYAADEVRGKEWFANFLPARDRERIRALFRTATQDVPTRGNVNAIVTRSGEEREIEWHDQTLRDAQGRVTALLSVGQDVTERRKAEQARRASEERLKEAQRIARIGSWELDIVSGRLLWSDEIFRLFEIDPAKFGATYEAFLNAIHPQDREAVSTAYTDSLRTRRPYAITHRLLMADGRVKYVHERCESDFAADGTPLRSLGTVQDVTAQQLAEEALLVTHTAVETAINAIAMADLNGIMTYANRAFLELWGLERPDQVLGHRPAEFVPEADRIIAAMQRDGRWQGEVKGRRADGSTMDIQLSAHLVKDARDRPLCLMGSFLDVSERKRAEEAVGRLNAELEQRVKERTAQLQAANRELEAFTYSVSHDLKAPLRGIDGYSRLLLDGYSDKIDAEGRQFLQYVREGTQRMNQLIEDLLAYSRMERRETRLAQLDPRQIVETLLAERDAEIRTRGIELKLELAPVPVTADREGLAMALRNLLENALKFTRDTAQPRIDIGAREDGAACVLWVRDNGIGFDMKYHDRIFAMFQRLNRSEDYPGTGIGLAIVRKAMERMGGRVWAESEPGRGATFYLEIPR